MQMWATTHHGENDNLAMAKRGIHTYACFNELQIGHTATQLQVK
jgi:hypothetical protein